MKKSLLIPQQVPSFVLSEYPLFVDFLKAYYQWLEQEYSLPQIESLIDIEKTLDEFVQYFQKELDVFGALDTVDSRFFLKNIKQLYKAKGSESAFKFFFRLVYEKESTIFYPWDRVLKTSDGKWTQDTVLFINVSVGTPDLIVDKNIHLQTSTQNYTISVERYEPVEIVNNGIREQHPTIFQFFVKKEYYNQIPTNVRVTYGNVFVGTTTSTTTTVKIFKTGQGYRIGELYDIQDGTGSGSIIKITKVDINGGILGAQLVKYGTGYKVDSSVSIVPKSLKGVLLEGGSSGSTVDVRDSYQGIVERGQLNTFDYNAIFDYRMDDPADSHGPALSPTYAGVVVQGFYDENDSGIVLDTKYVATLQFTTGSVAKYPGYYASNDGLLSDDIYLQDNYYYQVYSYVIDIEEQLQSYRHVLKELLHPSGFALFGQYDIRNEFDIIPQVQEIVASIDLSLSDEFFSITNINSINVNTGLRDYQSILDEISHSFDKYLTESLDPQTEAGGIWLTNNMYGEVSYFANDTGLYTENSVQQF